MQQGWADRNTWGKSLVGASRHPTRNWVFSAPARRDLTLSRRDIAGCSHRVLKRIGPRRFRAIEWVKRPDCESRAADAGLKHPPRPGPFQREAPSLRRRGINRG